MVHDRTSVKSKAVSSLPECNSTLRRPDIIAVTVGHVRQLLGTKGEKSFKHWCQVLSQEKAKRTETKWDDIWTCIEIKRLQSIDVVFPKFNMGTLLSGGKLPNAAFVGSGADFFR